METDLCKYIMESPKRCLDEKMCKMLIYQVLIALRYLHSNNCGHLDVKCENILLSFLKPVPFQETKRSARPGCKEDLPLVKLADFGYSRIIGEHSFRKTRVGTVCYAPPLSLSPSSIALLESLLRSGNLPQQGGLQSLGGHLECGHRSLRRSVRYVALRRERCSSRRRNRTQSEVHVLALTLGRRFT